MKIKIFLFALITGISLMLIPANLFAGDGYLVVDKLKGGLWIHYKMPGLDSLETFESNPFDASEVIFLILTTQNAYKERDTTINNYFRLGNVFANIVTGTSSDSVQYLYLKGAMSDGVFRTFDTLSTAKNTPCRTRIDLYNTLPLYTQWTIAGKIFDTGTSQAVVYVDIFIPYASNRDGSGEGFPGENAKAAINERSRK